SGIVIATNTNGTAYINNSLNILHVEGILSLVSCSIKLLNCCLCEYQYHIKTSNPAIAPTNAANVDHPTARTIEQCNILIIKKLTHSKKRIRTICSTNCEIVVGSID